MKKLLHLFSASIMLFNGCASYDGDIDDLNNQIDDLTSSQIATINEQITAIKTTIPNLEKADADLESYINTLEDTANDLEDAVEKNKIKIDELKTELAKAEADATAKAEIIAQLESATSSLKAELAKVNTAITELQKADIALDEKIKTLNTYIDDELSDMKDWSDATFATLKQYSDLVDDVTTVNGQITSLNTSVSTLETSLSDTAKSINDTIATLEGDVAQDLVDLSSEITTTYTSAIASAKSDIEAAYEGAIETAIDNLESSLQTWVSNKLTGYYTIAESDANLTALQEMLEAELTTQKNYLVSLINALGGSDDFVNDVESILETIENIEKAIDNNATDIATLKTDLATAKTELTDAYTDAISTSITTLEGKLSDEVDAINTNIDSKITEVNDSISALSDRITAIESEITTIMSTLSDIQAQIADIMSQIQSITYIPLQSNGDVTMMYTRTPTTKEAGTATMMFELTPSSTAADILKVWETALTIKCVYTTTSTRATTGDFTQLSIDNAKVSGGILTLTVSGDGLNQMYFNNYISTSVSLNISDGYSNLSSSYINMVPKAENPLTVSFYTNGGSFVSQQYLAVNTTINEPDAPTRDHHTFGGWFSDYYLNTPWNFTTRIYNDTKLYAYWLVDKFNVYFDSNEGTDVSTQVVAYNCVAKTPDVPTRNGYTLDCWCTDPELASPYNFTTPITGDLNLYAKWTINTYTVKFVSNSGESVSPQSLDYNEVASNPTTTRTGYTFDCWCSDSELTSPYNFTTPITDNLTLYAKWTINTYTISFESNDGSLVKEQHKDYNTCVNEPSSPTRPGYAFGGWYSDLELTKAYDFTTKVTNNFTLYAKWIETKGGNLPDLEHDQAW